MSGRRVDASPQQRSVLNDNPTLQIVEQRGDGSIYAQKPEGAATNVYRIAADGGVSPVGGAQPRPITPVDLNRMVPTTDDISTMPRPAQGGTQARPGTQAQPGQVSVPGQPDTGAVPQTPPRAIDRLNDVERPPVSRAVREVRLNLEDFNNSLEARRDAYEPGQGRIPALDRMTEQLNLDTNYVRAQRQDALENRPNPLQRVWQNTEQARQNVIDGVHAYRDAVPNAVGRVGEVAVDRVVRPVVRGTLDAAQNAAQPVLNFANDTVIQPMTNALGNTVGRAADDFFHNNPVGNDIRLTSRELLVGNPDPLNTDLPRNSLRDEAGRTVYEALRAPPVQRTMEGVQSAVDLAGAAFTNLATRAEPVVTPITTVVRGTIDNIRTAGQVAATQVLPGAIGWAAATGNIQPLSPEDARDMLRGANFSTRETHAINVGAIGVRTSPDFPIDARVGAIYTGPTIKGASPQAIMRGDFANIIEFDQMIPSAFSRQGPGGDPQYAYNSSFRGMLAGGGITYSVGTRDLGEALQVRGNAVVQLGTFGGGYRAEAGAITNSEGFQAGTRGYGALGGIRYSFDPLNVDIPQTNIPGAPSRFVFSASRPTIDPTLFPNDGLPRDRTSGDGVKPGGNAPSSALYGIAGGGHNPLIDHQATLSFAPNVQLSGVAKARLDNQTSMDGAYIGTSVTNRGGLFRLGGFTTRRDGSTYEFVASRNPMRLQAAEDLQAFYPDVANIRLPNGDRLFASPEQIRLEGAQNGLNGLQNRLLANPANPEVRAGVEKLMDDLTTRQPQAVQDAARRELGDLLDRAGNDPSVLRGGGAIRDLFEKYSGMNPVQTNPAPQNVPSPTATPPAGTEPPSRQGR